MSQQIKTWQERMSEASFNLLRDREATASEIAMLAYIADLEAELARRTDSGKVAEVVQGQEFMRAWIRLPKLPGSMMHGREGIFGPVPASCSGWITTSENEKARWDQRGEESVEVWRCTPAADSAATEQTAYQLERMTKYVHDLKPAERSDSAAEPVARIMPEFVAKAREALDNLDDYARMNTGIAATGPVNLLKSFIDVAATPASADVGDLPPAPEHFALFNINGHDGHRIKGWALPQMEQYGEACFAAGQASSAALPKGDEAKHALWLLMEHHIHRYLISNSAGRWDGAEKAARHIDLCQIYVAVQYGLQPEDVRLTHNDEFEDVHEKTQLGLTDCMDEVIGFPLESRPDYDDLAPKFFDKFIELARAALSASAEKGEDHGL